MKKLITLLLLITTSASASISILGPLTGQTQNYSYYDIDVVLEDDQYITGFGGPETQHTYYEYIYMTPDSAGDDFRFSNYSSSLQGSAGSTTDTQVLLYDADNFDLTNVITNMPDIFNSSSTFGWGGGQSLSSGQGTGVGEGAFDGLFDLEEKQYLVVFTSFSADALGSMDIEINGPSELYFSTVPEPSIYALLFGWVAFMCVVIRRRNA
tara:strand:- start:5561 stop:6190 length:630 start_codon:yes stop_codon:yes gene_type:complete